jgi:hypothetical protein
MNFTFIEYTSIQGTYFTSDNEPDRIENATHNTFAKSKVKVKVNCKSFYNRRENRLITTINNSINK